jgi:hypothetical protein
MTWYCTLSALEKLVHRRTGLDAFSCISCVLGLRSLVVTILLPAFTESFHLQSMSVMNDV